MSVFFRILIRRLVPSRSAPRLINFSATWDDIRGILDDIKTSTGFSTAGATFADVELMKKYIGKDVKVKAAGGISSFDDAEKFISLGAERLGTSRLIKIR